MPLKNNIKTNNPQNVTHYPNNNTYFLIWNFKEGINLLKIQSVFKRLCALVINLNNSALDRFPNSKASCVMGIGYEAWLNLIYLHPCQKIHNLSAWKSLSVEDREKVIGRSKEHDIEMSDNVKPGNAHIALANIGDDFKVVRDNMPFGNVATNKMGTYFICYASTFTTVEKMLINMFIGNPPGNYDHILDFSTSKNRNTILCAIYGYAGYFFRLKEEFKNRSIFKIYADSVG